MRQNGRVPHPIPYQGSKRFLANAILGYLPQQIERLVEPFAGSAAISLAVASRQMAASFWLNDAHEPLAALWKRILNNPDMLAAEYAKLWHDQAGNERAFFDVVRSQFNANQEPRHFLYLLARCVKAAIRYNSDGQFNNTPDNRRLGAKPDEMKRRVKGAAALLAGQTVVTSTDYRQVIRECHDGDVIYMDPPYQGVCATRDHRYLPKVDHNEFYDELSLLVKRRVMFAVSYDGRCGDKHYGKPIPRSIGLTHLELFAGRSTQATLLGRADMTFESLYLSPALAGINKKKDNAGRMRQLAFA